MHSILRSPFCVLTLIVAFVISYFIVKEIKHHLKNERILKFYSQDDSTVVISTPLDVEPGYDFITDEEEYSHGESFTVSAERENILKKYSDLNNASVYNRSEVSELSERDKLLTLWSSPWTYQCINKLCRRVLLRAGENQVPSDVCWLNCRSGEGIWPYPTIQVTLSKALVAFKPSNLKLEIVSGPSKSSEGMMRAAAEIVRIRLKQMLPKPSKTGDAKNSGENNVILLRLKATNANTSITLDTDEEYSLHIVSTQVVSTNMTRGTAVVVEIKGKTFFGVRHGLETFSQLVAADEINNCLQIVSTAEIMDEPAYPYRGLLIDTGRNFIPVSTLKSIVDAMSYNKLNMLHWHITDSNSFPFYSSKVPQMTKYGAYGASKIYFPEDIKDFVQYSLVRGVKIIPEFDAPAHAGNGWEWGSSEGLGDLALCTNKAAWWDICSEPPCGLLNPVNNNTYNILGKIYEDMFNLFDGDLFHMGGDDVSFGCWKRDVNVRNWMRTMKIPDYLNLWGYFQTEAFRRLKEANGKKAVTPIVWSSKMTEIAAGRKFLKASDYIIQISMHGKSQHAKKLLSENYKIIFSNFEVLGLDEGFGSWLGTEHDSTYKIWQTLYDEKFTHFVDSKGQSYLSHDHHQILGGEAILRTQKVNEHNIQMKLWPRSSAFAENLWSNPDSRTSSVYSRLIHHNNRMIQRGISADQLQPESCYQFSGNCDDPYFPI